MESLPPVVYSLSFWKALTYAAAGILAALAALGKVPVEWALSAGALLSAVLTVLNWLHITPELRLKALENNLRRSINLLEEAKVLRNDALISARSAEVKKEAPVRKPVRK